MAHAQMYSIAHSHHILHTVHGQHSRLYAIDDAFGLHVATGKLERLLLLYVKLLVVRLLRSHGRGACTEVGHGGHITRSVCGCRGMEASACTPVITSRFILTVLVAEDKSEDGVQTEEAKEIPANAADPGHVHVARIDTALKHKLEAEREREGKSDQDKSGEEVVDPAHDDRLRHHGDHALLRHIHHLIHLCGIRKGVLRKILLAGLSC